MLKIPFLSDQKFNALALNYILPPFFDKIWERASLKVAADGGANRIHSFYNNKGNSNYPVPNMISGDFDSIRNDVRKNMEKQGTEFVSTPNQDYNDCEKSLYEIIKKDAKHPVVILGGYGGRFDQTMGVINATLKFDFPIFMLDSLNIMTWIRPNIKGIIIPDQLLSERCSLLPLSCQVRNVKTNGLKINIDGPLELGNNITVSNKHVKNDFLIETTDPILWSCQLPNEKHLILD